MTTQIKYNELATEVQRKMYSHEGISLLFRNQENETVNYFSNLNIPDCVPMKEIQSSDSNLFSKMVNIGLRTYAEAKELGYGGKKLDELVVASILHPSHYQIREIYLQPIATDIIKRASDIEKIKEEALLKTKPTVLEEYVRAVEHNSRLN